MSQEQHHNKVLLEKYTKQLRALEIQEASFGIYTPSFISVEIAEIREKISQLESQILNNTLKSSDDVAPFHELPKSKLFEIIKKYFNEEELKELCFTVNVDYESLVGNGKSAKARELITYCQRQGLFSVLYREIQKLRPHAFS